MQTQHDMWNSKHAAGELDSFRTGPSTYAVRMAGVMDHKGALLELGCGVGVDAAYFASLGHSVTATDFSEIAIQKNRSTFSDVTFKFQDISEPLLFAEESFDYVYANLSLHYFDDETTRAAFRGIARVLKPNGKLLFRCKSVRSIDEKTNAEDLGDDIYLSKGHLRHLFSTDYIKDITHGLFELEQNEYTEDTEYGHMSFFVEALARKI